MRGHSKLIGYIASKAAISGRTRSLTHELGEADIQVNPLLPSADANERRSRLWRILEEDRGFIELQSLKYRLAAPHAACSMLFPASDDRDGVTAQNLIVEARLAQRAVAD